MITHSIQPTFTNLAEKKLVGLKLSMSLANYTVGKLWAQFMPRRKEVSNRVGNDLISMAVYPADYFRNFNPAAEFVRWAAVEVTDADNLPEGMESFLLPSGLYAVFQYKGPGGDNSVFRYIFETWLPGSGYRLDNRPHFEVLGEKYKANDPESEEEIWIPVVK